MFRRFLISGGVNTGASYLIYCLLLYVIPYAWAYSIAYIFGIFFSYLLSRYYVFHSVGKKYALGWVFLIYFVQYSVGILLIRFWVEFLMLDRRLAPLFSVPILFFVSYLFNKSVFLSSRDGSS